MVMDNERPDGGGYLSGSGALKGETVACVITAGSITEGIIVSSTHHLVSVHLQSPPRNHRIIPP